MAVAADTAAQAPAPAVPAPSRYIVSAPYDWLLFLGPPLGALGLGIAISGIGPIHQDWSFGAQRHLGTDLLIGVLIHAHLVAVFFRSHGNPSIFRLHPYRFLAVPFLLYAAMLASPWILIGVSVLATFWDVYHSGMQTFGFARIYDRKQGNDANVGRRLDWWLNHLLYAGPILAGATMMDHFESFYEFQRLGDAFFTRVPVFMEGHQLWFTWTILAGGTLFLLYYVLRYAQLARQGYQVSFLKVFLLASTGLCSIYTWGFNSWGEAFVIMNFFHAVQYLGLVWATEKTNMMRMFRVETRRFGTALAGLLFVGLIFAYGLWVHGMDKSVAWLWPIALVVSIMHFWYDGFIWSVRQKQV